MAQGNLARGAVAPKLPVFRGRKPGPVIFSPASKKAPGNDSVAVPLLSGTSDEWKAQIKTDIANGKITVGSEVMDNTGRSWVYIEHLKESDKYFLAAKEYYVDERGKKEFTHDEALKIAEKAGAQLMSIKTGMIACNEFKKSISGALRNFKDDLVCWLSDLDVPNGKYAYIQYFDDRDEYIYFAKSSRGPKARKGSNEEYKIYNCQRLSHREYTTARVVLALEL